MCPVCGADEVRVTFHEPSWVNGECISCGVEWSLVDGQTYVKIEDPSLTSVPVQIQQPPQIAESAAIMATSRRLMSASQHSIRLSVAKLVRFRRHGLPYRPTADDSWEEGQA